MGLVVAVASGCSRTWPRSVNTNRPGSRLGCLVISSGPIFNGFFHPLSVLQADHYYEKAHSVGFISDCALIGCSLFVIGWSVSKGRCGSV